MKTLWALAAAALLAACTQTTTDTPTPPAEVGRLIAVTRAGSVDIEIDATQALLAVAATVKLGGASITGPVTLGAAAADRDLFKQKPGDGAEVRFAISDGRALKIQRSGVLVRIPVNGTPSSVEVTAISAATDDGKEVILKGFSGTPEARQ